MKQSVVITITQQRYEIGPKAIIMITNTQCYSKLYYFEVISYAVLGITMDQGAIIYIALLGSTRFGF